MPFNSRLFMLQIAGFSGGTCDMGLLRFILATAVATGHSGCFWGYCVFPAGLAVQLFYVLSGFLIAFILNEKYSDLWLFYSNRALRIYVPYLFVLAISFAAVLPLARITGYYPGYAAPLLNTAHSFDPLTWTYVVLSGIGILGQDLGLWLGFDGHLFLTNHFAISSPPVWELQLLPQAWSLSLELTFYVLAPFLVRRGVMVLLCVVVGAYVLRAIGYHFGLGYDPWTSRFFPFELAHFAGGALAYKLYAATRSWWIWRRSVCLSVMAAVIGAVLFYDSKPWIGANHPLTFIAAIALSMPFLFRTNIPFDAWLGELSYPIYLIHWPLQFALAMFVGPALPLSVWSVPVTILAAFGFVILVDRPLERMRQARLKIPASPPRMVNAGELVADDRKMGVGSIYSKTAILVKFK